MVPVCYTFILLSCKLTLFRTGCSSPFVLYRCAFIGQTTVCTLSHAHPHWAMTMFVDLKLKSSRGSTSIHQTICLASDQTLSLICLLTQMCLYSSYGEHIYQCSILSSSRRLDFCSSVEILKPLLDLCSLLVQLLPDITLSYSPAPVVCCAARQVHASRVV